MPTTVTIAAPAASRLATSPAARIESVDFVRGVVMILMAIDHVRVYAGVPAGGPEFGVFFTRWITHFVAPAFVFLAGTSAYLHGRKLEDTGALAGFLVKRGLLLILLELTLIRVSWTFNLDFANYNLAGVIWMIGWCMILLAACVRLPVNVGGGVGIAIIALHNLTDVFGLQQSFGDAAPPWYLQLLYTGGVISIGPGGPPLAILYVIFPWIGVMMAGYGFGALLQRPPAERRRIILRLGIALTLAFLLLRGIDVYGDPRPWRSIDWLPAAFAFLNTTKYPASLSFLLMTLGPALILLAASENWRGRGAEVVKTFGRVPLFYYLLHIPLIHLAAVGVSLVREGGVNPWLFGNHPMWPPDLPAGYRWSLGLLYLVFAGCVAALYWPCRWYARVRKNSRWLSYL